MENNINIFFNITASSAWIGGVNYYINLFKAISKVESPTLTPVLDFDQELPEVLKSLSSKINFTYRRSIKYYAKKMLNLLLHKNFDASYNQKKIYKNFSVTSHCSKIKSEKNIQWIPDFQHIHLSEMFSKEECYYRDELFLNIARNADIVILSSKDAQKDFIKCFPEYASKTRVLHFVSYFPKNLYSITDSLDKTMKEKYNLPEKYYFMPNQFWKHKNHISVFKAVALLKQNGINIHVVCTGNTNDYRNPEFFTSLTDFIDINSIKENIHILGLIDYTELVYLLRYSIALLQPSLFEGWSSTVEEAKSIGKNCILSNLNVHIEQAPKEAIYFDPLDVEKLASILADNYAKLLPGPNKVLEEEAKASMEVRMLDFGNAYKKLILELI